MWSEELTDSYDSDDNGNDEDDIAENDSTTLSELPDPIDGQPRLAIHGA